MELVNPETRQSMMREHISQCGHTPCVHASYSAINGAGCLRWLQVVARPYAATNTSIASTHVLNNPIQALDTARACWVRLGETHNAELTHHEFKRELGCKI